MKNIIILFTLFLFACQVLVAQDEVRYTQSAAEIDFVKSQEAAYNAGNWDKFLANYQADAEIDHNGNTATPKQVVASLKQSLSGCSYYKLTLLPAELERVITDRGEMWVNSWGTWQGILKGTKDTITMSIHIAFEFKDGKISKEFAYYDNSASNQALAATSFGEDQLLYITEDTAKPGQEENYKKVVANYIKALDDKKVPGVRWISAVTEDNATSMHQTEIKSLMDLQRLNDEEQQGSDALGAKTFQEINGSFLSAVSNRKKYVVRRHADRSYWPAEGIGGDVNYIHFLAMSVDAKDIPIMMGLASEVREMSKAGNSKLPFAFFTYEIGGAMTDFVVAEYALSEEDYKTRKAAEEKMMDTEAGKAWYKKLEAILTSFEETKLIPAPALSRPAQN